MHEESGDRSLDVVDIEHHARARVQASVITQLAARFRVEGRTIENDLYVLAGKCCGNDVAIEKNADDGRLRLRFGNSQ